MVSNDATENNCPIPINVLEQDFSQRWETENNNKIPAELSVSPEDQEKIDEEFEDVVPSKMVLDGLRSLDINKSAGPDKILPRWLKATAEQSSIILAHISTYMIRYNYIPGFMKEFKTTIIHKGGEKTN